MASPFIFSCTHITDPQLFFARSRALLPDCVLASSELRKTISVSQPISQSINQSININQVSKQAGRLSIGQFHQSSQLLHREIQRYQTKHLVPSDNGLMLSRMCPVSGGTECALGNLSRLISGFYHQFHLSCNVVDHQVGSPSTTKFELHR